VSCALDQASVEQRCTGRDRYRGRSSEPIATLVFVRAVEQNDPNATSNYGLAPPARTRRENLKRGPTRARLSRFRQNTTAPIHLPDLRQPFSDCLAIALTFSRKAAHSPSRAENPGVPGSASAGRSLFAFRLLW
jgi:hypothetical protein